MRIERRRGRLRALPLSPQLLGVEVRQQARLGVGRQGVEAQVETAVVVERRHGAQLEGDGADEPVVIQPERLQVGQVEERARDGPLQPVRGEQHAHERGGVAQLGRDRAAEIGVQHLATVAG